MPDQQIPNAPAAAPAQPAADPSQPQTLTARDAAIRTGNTGDYRAARRAERLGKPLAEVTLEPADVDTAPAQPTAPAPAAAPAQPQLSRKEREQQETNERIRRAVESANADLRAELEQLRRGAPRPDASGQPGAKPAAPAQPEPDTWQRAIAQPDVAQAMLTEEQFFAKYPEAPYAAYARYWFGYDQVKQQVAHQQRTHGEQLAAQAHQRISTFDARVQKVAETDPGIQAEILPLAQKLGNSGGPFQIIRDLVLDSDVGPQLLKRWKANEGELLALAKMPAALEAIGGQRAVRAHIQHIIKEFGRLEQSIGTPAAAAPAATAPAPAAKPKTISDAPNQDAPIGRRAAEAADPKAAAIRNGDTRSYRAIRRAERAAGGR